MSQIDTAAELAAQLPDEPGLVDTRGMLLSGRCQVLIGDPQEGFVVLATDWSVASVVGRPDPALIREATRRYGTTPFNVLIRPEQAAWVHPVLPGWRARQVVIHTLAGRPRPAPGWADVRLFDVVSAPPLDHLPAGLRRELGLAMGHPGAAGRSHDRTPIPIAAAFERGLPVSFCYPVWCTERWWDVSVDTLEAYRRRGLGSHVSIAMIRRMTATGLAPVWGALDDNHASLGLAAKLGFIATDRLMLLTSPDARAGDAPITSGPSSDRTSPGRTLPGASG